ncbi:alpha-amylase family glycosyl hydrolase [Azomonas macrocytogenes]|uniref:Alpha-glucosidase n=1 Tax=Azomonas macrocytogenes TaxID=69962 RepID=A0A839T4I3_AZOMA|nr:alpha-amylase family glycosyl hydrolase [Azomonas macrocytogenes]MBB3104447.1 alpha-glucosidase [Azomonas macrocytogenes]
MLVTARPWWRDAQINRRASIMAPPGETRWKEEWWENAVIYQVLPWSYKDSDGDGIGDLQGIIERLDYIGSLGVDAIWLTPIFVSPMDDLGYDITDHHQVSPLFGSMDDFKCLLELAHKRGLRVVLDMVWNHTSNQHEWFQQSRQDRNNPKADWYVWADPGKNGGPPNNWLSSFSGDSAWHFDEIRQQYYLANFLASQPDLNWFNAEVRAQVLNCARFWLDLGIDGMRLDAVNFFCHDPQLNDNPIRGQNDPLPHGIDPDNPLAKQRFCNSFCRPETLDMLAPLRRLVNQYPGVMLLGEVIEADDSIRLAAQYTAGDQRLHLAYHGGLLFKERMSARRLREVVGQALEEFANGGACWIVGNHDFGRLHSQWNAANEPYPREFYLMMAVLLLVLPGAFCLWQGDELGFNEARIPEDISPEQLRDPFGRLMYPKLKGRDGSRTPMSWTSEEPNAGFTTGTPWLPISRTHFECSVAAQQSTPDSLLNHWRSLLHWRMTQPALQSGSARLLDLNEHVFALLREESEQRLLCIFNLSDQTVSVDLREFGPLLPVQGIGYRKQLDSIAELAPWDVVLADMPVPSEKR